VCYHYYNNLFVKNDAAWNVIEWAETHIILGNVKTDWVQLGLK
jgi:hypothetical protein